MIAPHPLSDSSSSDRSFFWKTTALHITFLTLLGLLVCLPVLIYGLPDWGNDSIEHARWTKHFDIQVWNGELYPRWLSGVNAGLGGPSFVIYPALPSYAGALFWPFVKDSARSGWYAIGFSCVLATILSGITCYFWCRSFASPTAALFGGALYVIVPYHLAGNMFTHGAAGQLWSVVWLPLILLCVVGVIRGIRWSVVGLVLSYYLLVFTHLPTTVCFSVIPLAAAAFLSEAGKKLKSVLIVAASMAIGAALAAPYLLTAALDAKNLRTEATHLGDYDYHRWWLFQIQPLFDARTRLMLMALATFAVLACAFWLCLNVRQNKSLFKLAIFQFAIAVGAIFMASQLSAPIWYLIPTLQNLPFPNRFLMILNLMVPGVAAIAFPFLRLPRFRMVTAFMGVGLLSWMVADVWAAKNAFSIWRPFGEKQAIYYSKVNGYDRDYPAFWPRWSRAAEVNDFPAFEDYIAEKHPRAMRLATAAGKEIGTISLVTWLPRHIVTRVSTPEPVRLTINHFYYPGWTGHVEGSPRNIPAEPSAQDGFIQIDLPQGAYVLDVDLQKSPAERAGAYIALCSVAILLGLVYWTVRMNRTPSAVPAHRH
jgi:hypothetical protein